MIKNISRASFVLLLSIFLFSLSLFSRVAPNQATQMISGNDVDNSIGIVIEESAQTIDESKNSTSPDLGDDQAFPFIPGFGTNSGKD